MDNAEKLREKRKKPKYRAIYLISGYRRQDKLYNRGECTLTQQDIFDLWEKGCYWCGETDWHKLGVDRIDNSKPHTIDNVVCSCWNCNNKRQKKEFEDFKTHKSTKVVQYTKDMEYIAEYESIKEAAIINCVDTETIRRNCEGLIKKPYKYIWKYKTLNINKI